MIRTTQAAKLEELAQHATVPVINGLTDCSHPCQIMADVMTLEEHKGRPPARSSPGAATATTWPRAGSMPPCASASSCASPARELLRRRAACSTGRAPQGGRVERHRRSGAAVAGADCVVTDTWVSMGVEASVDRHNMLAPYRVDERLMAKAKPDAIFMHCLPAKRGEEVTAGVIDGPQSVVWDEAENRLHAQKGILAWCLA